KIVAGNWKMNKTLDEGLKLASEIVNMVQDESKGGVDVVLFPPFIHLNSVQKLISGASQISLGAQNCSEHEEGAYTGDVSAAMLTSVGGRYGLGGHSERREYHQESDELLAKKVEVALKHGITPIFCCGEPLEVREADGQAGYVTEQLTNSLFGLSKEDFG